MVLVKQTYTKNELEFLSIKDKKDNTSNYNYFICNSFKYDYCRFIIIDRVIEKDIVYEVFDGLLDNLLCYTTNSETIIIFFNKDRVILNELAYLLTDDLGMKFNIFDGFKINVNKLNYLDEVVDLINQVKPYLKHPLCEVRDLIYLVNEHLPSQKEKLKQIIFDKYLSEDFYYLINGLFNNNLNILKTSNAIYMHRNTINNKIETVLNDTNLELSKFLDALSVYLLFKGCNI